MIDLTFFSGNQFRLMVDCGSLVMILVLFGFFGTDEGEEAPLGALDVILWRELDFIVHSCS